MVNERNLKGLGSARLTSAAVRIVAISASMR